MTDDVSDLLALVRAYELPPGNKAPRGNKAKWDYLKQNGWYRASGHWWRKREEWRGGFTLATAIREQRRIDRESAS